MKLGEGHVENTAAAETIGSWNVQATIDLCGWLTELGVTETIIPLPPLDSYDAYLERLHWVAEEIMRSEEHTSELQSLMRISYAVFCLKKKQTPNTRRHS